MVEFEVIAAEDVKYGNNNFIEVALKKVEGGNEFVSISKGFIDTAGNKRFRGGLGIQLGIADQVAEKIREMAKAGTPAQPEQAPAEAPAEQKE
jgi:hypothetical protein